MERQVLDSLDRMTLHSVIFLTAIGNFNKPSKVEVSRHLHLLHLLPVALKLNLDQ